MDAPQQNKSILIAGFSVPYSFSDEYWTAENISTCYNHWISQLKLSLQLHGKSQEQISDEMLKIPPLKWYALNKIGFAGYSISKEGEIINHKKKPPQNTIKGTFDPDKGYSVSLYDENKKEHKRFVHRLMAIMFLPPPSHANDVVVRIDKERAFNDLSNLRWAGKNESKNGMTYAKREEFKRPVTMYRLLNGYSEDYPYITWFSVQDAVNGLAEEVAGYRIEHLAASIRNSGLSNIVRACRNKEGAYGRRWRFEADQRSYGEIWKTLQRPGFQPLEISTRGRIRIYKQHQHEGKELFEPYVGTGIKGAHGYKYCSLTDLSGNIHSTRVDALVLMTFLPEVLLASHIIYHFNQNALDSNIYNLGLFTSFASLQRFIMSSPVDRQAHITENKNKVKKVLEQLFMSYYERHIIYSHDVREYNAIHIDCIKYVPETVYVTLSPEKFCYRIGLDESKSDPRAHIPIEFRKRQYDVCGKEIKKNSKKKDLVPKNTTVHRQHEQAMLKHNNKRNERLKREQEEEEEEQAQAQRDEERNEREAEAFTIALCQSGLDYDEFVKQHGPLYE